MPGAHRPAASRRPGVGLAWLLALLLLQAQALGLWHGVAHGLPHGPAAHTSPLAAAGGQPGALGLAAEPFGHAADDESSCRLYDAIGQAAAPAGDAPQPGASPAAGPLCGARFAVAVFGEAQPYEARAPPA